MKTIWLTLFLCVCGTMGSFAQKSKNNSTKPIYLRDALLEKELAAIKNKYDRFKSQTIGHFSNHQYIIDEGGNTKEKAQEFIVIPIFKDRTNEFWVYKEFFASGLPDAPLSQRIENYIRVGVDTIRVEIYRLENPQNYINEWKKELPFEGLTRDKLLRDAPCDLFMVENEDKPFLYNTIPPTNIECTLQSPKGAAKYMTLLADVSDEGYLTFLKVYDANKTLIRESNPAGTRFRRLDFTHPEYINYVPSDKEMRQMDKIAKKNNE